MTQPCLQINLRPHVTLTFDRLPPKLIVSCPCPVDHLCHALGIKIGSFLLKYRLHKLITDGRTDGRTTGEHNASACQSGVAEA